MSNKQEILDKKSEKLKKLKDKNIKEALEKDAKRSEKEVLKS